MDLSKLSDSDLVALQSGDLSKVSDQGLMVLSQPQERTWGQTGVEALKNLPSSVGNVVSGVAETVAHPVKTLSGISDLLQSGLSKVIPQSMQDVRAQPAVERGQQAGAALRDFYKQRYGSEAGLKEAIATDPAGVMADISTVATGGGAALSKVPTLAKAGQVVSKVGSYTDPLAMALRGGAGAISGTSAVAKKLAGLQSGAGEEALTQAYKAGQTGGERGTTFLENMRGEAPITDVLDAAKADLAEMQRQKQVEYRANMANVKADKTVMDIQPISDAIDNAIASNSFKGVSKDDKAANALKAVKAEVDDWQWKKPAEYHTPEGLDTLKQRIGSILESVPLEQKNTARVVKDVYNAVKAEISKQAPEYSKAMKAYTDASEQIREIEKALIGGNKAAADTSMRKLQSLMRNNAQTNYGYRTQLAQQLEQAGGHELMPALAGQALNQWTPRGIQRATASLGGLAAYTAGGLPLAATEAALSSPRLMGEVAYKGGQLSRGLRKINEKAQLPLNAANIDPRILANYLYQINPQGQQ
jgi:hypothetical protein